MKTKKSFYGIIVIVALFGFLLVDCDNENNGVNDSDDGTLTGIVSIGGIPRYTHRIWAITSSLGGNGTISYKWTRGTSTTIGTGVYYDITAADIGQTIIVQVSRSGETGTKTSTAVTPVYHKIGDEGPAGGRVFYIDNPVGYWLPDSKQYIEIAAEDVSASLSWGLNGIEVSGPGSQLGNGKIYHDAAIAEGAEAGTAVKACDEYTVTLYNGELWQRTFDDWFLPGLGEMAWMLDYQEKISGYYSILTYNNNIPGLSGKYWTSFPYDDNESYFMGFFTAGHVDYGSLHNGRVVSNKVRAIRWF